MERLNLFSLNCDKEFWRMSPGSTNYINGAGNLQNELKSNGNFFEFIFNAAWSVFSLICHLLTRVL